MAIIPRWRSYKETFYRESSRECLNWRSYEGGALIKVADSAISTVLIKWTRVSSAQNDLLGKRQSLIMIEHHHHHHHHDR